jgi:hypothetical protein
MGLKDAFENIAKTVTDAVDDAVQTVKHNAKDAASEATHHAAAQAEQVKRAGAGDSLSPLEVTQSVATQIREETLAQVDSIKQTIRKNI